MGWLHGDATAFPPLQSSSVTRTGNVAQVFLGDEDWASTLRDGGAAMRPGKDLMFEVRDPAAEAWRNWNRERSHRRVDLPEVGTVETWVELTGVNGQLVSF